jgi:hypothetical protein
MRALGIAFVMTVIAASCGGGAGPGGFPTTYHRCAPYNGNKCAGVQFPNYYQCDSQPGARCVTAPGTSPDPNQGVWCCEFGCVRGDPMQDGRCPSGRGLYYCNPDAKVDPIAVGCVAGPYSSQICC